MTPEEKIFLKYKKSQFFVIGFSSPEFKHLKANMGNYQLRNFTEGKDADEAWVKLELASYHFLLINVDSTGGSELLENVVESNRFLRTPIFVFSKTPDVYEKSYANRKMVGRFHALPFNLAQFEKELANIMQIGEFERSKIGGMSESLDAYTKGCKAHLEGNLDEAKDQFKLCLRHDPKFVDGYIKAAAVMIDQEDFDRALRVLEKASGMDPNNSKILYLMGMLEANRKNKDEARKMFDKALELEPDNVNLIIDIGNACLDADWLDEAIDYFNNAKKKSPDFLYIYNRLGIALSRAQRFDEAENEYNLALKVDSNDVGVHFNIGMLWQRQGNTEKALGFFKKALLIDPNLSAAKDMIARLSQPPQAPKTAEATPKEKK